jgi:MFS family permease
MCGSVLWGLPWTKCGAGVGNPVCVLESETPAVSGSGAVSVSEGTALGDGPNYPPISRAIWALALFIFVYLLYFADAQLVTLLVTPIEQAYGIDDTRFSLLAAAPPVIAILAVGLPMAVLVDRWNRRNLLAAAVILWTGMNVLCAFAPGFWVLFALKVGVAVGGAWYYPTVVSLLSDLFAPRQRTLAFTLLQLCGTSGVGLAVMLSGGAIALSHRLAAFAIDGGEPIAWWRWAFILVSVPAPLGAALLFTIREPRRHLTRGTTSTATPAAAQRLLPYLKQNWTVCAAVILGTAAANILVFGSRSWLPEYFARAFAQKAVEASTLAGLILTLGSALGIGAGGVLAVWLRRRGYESANLAVVIASYTAPVVLLVLLPFVGAPVSAAVVFGVAFLLFNLHGGPQIDIIQGVVPNEIRGRFVTLVLMVSYLGAFIGPFVVGLLNDHVFDTRSGIRYSMSITLAVSCILAAFCWSYRARSMLMLLRLRGGIND